MITAEIARANADEYQSRVKQHLKKFIEPFRETITVIIDLHIEKVSKIGHYEVDVNDKLIRTDIARQNVIILNEDAYLQFVKDEYEKRGFLVDNNMVVWESL